MPERDELDRLIDSELARYAEPRAGLEQRVLAHVKTESLSRSWLFHRWQRWALAGALASAMVLFINLPRLADHSTSVNTADMTSPNHKPVRPATTVSGAGFQAPHSTQVAKTVQNALRRTKSSEIAERAHRPKLDVFPAPQPLSAEEQALVAIAAGQSDLARRNLIDSQRELNTPLQISEINIPPLTKTDEGNK